MLRWLIAWAVAASLIGAALSGSSHASSMLQAVLNGQSAAASCTGTLGVDGSVGVAASGTGSAALTLTLTTTKANDQVFIVALVNDQHILSISDAAGLSWSLRASSPSPPANGNDIEEWTAFSSGILSSDIITIHFTGTSVSFFSGTAFGVSGVKLSPNTFDANAAVPSHGTGALTLSTTSLNTMLIGGFRFGSTSTPTAGTGFTSIYNGTGGFFLAEQEIVSAAQSGTSIGIGTGSGNENGGIADAVVQCGSS